MPQADLAYFQATGVETPLYITYADREGTAPGVITFTMRRQPDWQPNLIDIELHFNDFDYTLVDCKVTTTTESNNGADLFWQVSALDRRFRWKFPRISGMYNKYLEDGSLWKKTEKSPQDLLSLLFDELGEENYDVSQAPNDQRYETNWANACVDVELDNLAQKLGCRICHMLDDTYAVLPAGVGTPPALDINVSSFTNGLTFTSGPDAIAVRFRRRNEVDVALQAVGIELDGVIKPIDKLTYAPTNGWGGEYPGEYGGVFDRIRSRYEQELARSCIWRYFQITPYGKKGDPITVPDYHGPSPTTLEEMLPIFAEGVAYDATLPGEDYFNRRNSPTVWGMHVNGSIQSRILDNTDANDPTKRAWQKEPYDIEGAVIQYVGFTVDPERGLIIFDEPIYAWDDDEGFQTAILTARISITLRDPDTLGEIFYEFKQDRNVPKKGTDPLVIVNDEVTADFWYVQGNPQDNKKLVNDVAQHYIDQAQKEFQTNNPATVDYNDWRAIEMSGAITEVTWQLTAAGPTTRVSYNDRHQYDRPSYNQVRLQTAQRAGFETTNIKRLDTKSLIQQINRQSGLL